MYIAPWPEAGVVARLPCITLSTLGTHIIIQCKVDDLNRQRKFKNHLFQLVWLNNGIRVQTFCSEEAVNGVDVRLEVCERSLHILIQLVVAY